MDDSAVPDLTRISIEDTNDPGAKVLTLTDETGRDTAFKIGPEGLSEVLQELLGLAAQWSEFDAEAARELSGMVPASNFQIGQGQDPTEGMLLVHIGPVQLGFLVPSPMVLQRVQEFAQRIRLVPIGPVQ